MEKKYILDKETTLLKLKRLAYEITERNYTEQQLFFAGIRESGYTVARLLAKEVMEISNIHVELVEIMMDKRYPVEVMLDREIGFNNQSIVIIDDVANSGRTMLYALKPLLQHKPRQIQTLALVERTHKKFPIAVDYVGLSISTTLQENIVVEVKEGEVVGAFMS